MQQRIPLKQAYDLFLLECQSRRFTNGTLRFYRGRLSLFLRWCEEQGIPHLDELTASHIRLYLVNLQERGVSSSYHHSHARAIRAFLNYCVRDELIEQSPFRRVQMPRLEKKVLSALSGGDVRRILRCAATERDKAIVLFLLDSGVRASELCATNVEDVDMATGAVLVRAGKGQKERTTYIGAKTRKQTMRYLIKERSVWYPHEPLFMTERAPDRLTYFGLQQILKRLKWKSGVADCHAHTFRRTFAINCLRNGMNIFVLAQLMGHADLTVLRQYLAFVENDLQTAQQQYGVVDNLS